MLCLRNFWFSVSFVRDGLKGTRADSGRAYEGDLIRIVAFDRSHGQILLS